MTIALAVQRARLGAPDGERLGRRLAVGLTADGGTRLTLRPLRPGAGAPPA